MPLFLCGGLTMGVANAAHHNEDGEEDTPLASSMDKTSAALKRLRKMDKSDWATGAEASRQAAAGILEGMSYIPKLVNEMPDSKEKTVAIADFRRIMGMSYAALCELELAYIAEDQVKVDAAMKKVKGTKKEGHKKYEDE